MPPSYLFLLALVIPPLLLALLVGLAVIGATPPNFGVVEPGKVFRSGRLTPRSLQAAGRDHRVRTVLDLGANPHNSSEEEKVASMARAVGVQRFRFHLKGNGTGNPNFYVQALRLMTDARALPLLVHCHAGAQRTGACIIFYRTIVQGWTMRDAFEEALRHRVRPNRDWKMLAYVADFAPRIARSFETGEPIAGFDPIPHPLDDPEGLIAASKAHLPAARAYPAASA